MASPLAPTVTSSLPTLSVLRVSSGSLSPTQELLPQRPLRLGNSGTTLLKHPLLFRFGTEPPGFQSTAPQVPPRLHSPQLVKPGWTPRPLRSFSTFGTGQTGCPQVTLAPPLRLLPPLPGKPGPTQVPRLRRLTSTTVRTGCLAVSPRVTPHRRVPLAVKSGQTLA